MPFDTTTGNLARNAQDYLANHPDAGWSRYPGIRVLWNGVTETDLPLSIAAFNKVCAGLTANKYVDRETLRSAIQDDSFCDDYVAQGSLSRRYKNDTMDDVIISIDYPPDSPYARTKDDCVRYLLGELTDGCDAANNPPNYKGGGTVTLGDVAFRIEPQAIRQPAEKGVDGGCDSTYSFTHNGFTLWGHGFASDDFGDALKKQLEWSPSHSGCALFSETWWFQSGLGSDGREWTAKFRTGVFQKKCVTNAWHSAGAPTNRGCHGTRR